MSTTRQQLEDRKREFLKALPHAREITVFMASPAGAALRRELEAVVWQSAVGDSVEETYFKLGMQEIAKRLLRLDTSERTGNATQS